MQVYCALDPSTLRPFNGVGSAGNALFVYNYTGDDKCDYRRRNPIRGPSDRNVRLGMMYDTYGLNADGTINGQGHTPVRPDGTFQLGTWTPKDAGQGSFVMCWAHRQGGNFVVHLGYLTIAGPLELTTTFTTAGAVFTIVLTKE